MRFVEKLVLTLQSGQFDKWASRVTDVGNGCHYQSEEGLGNGNIPSRFWLSPGRKAIILLIYRGKQGIEWAICYYTTLSILLAQK